MTTLSTPSQGDQDIWLPPQGLPRDGRHSARRMTVREWLVGTSENSTAGAVRERGNSEVLS